MRAETKATSIPPEVKKAVYIRDNGFCVLCGSPYGDPVAHVVRRSQGGKGIERNIVTLCPACHRESLYCYLVAYLKGFYPNWNREDMIYHKGVENAE